MKNRTLTAGAGAAALLALTGCSSYSGFTAVHGPAEPQDALPTGIQRVNPVMTSDFRFLTEYAGIKYFAAESSDFTTACIAVYPIAKTGPMDHRLQRRDHQ